MLNQIEICAAICDGLNIITIQVEEVPPSWLAATRSRPGSKDAFSATRQRNLSRSSRGGSTSGEAEESVNLTLVGSDGGGPHGGFRGAYEEPSSSAEGPLGDFIPGRGKRVTSVLCRGCAWAGGRWRAWTRHMRSVLEHVVDYIWNGPSEEEVGTAGGTSREEAGSYETHVLEESLQKVGFLLASGRV